MEILKTAVEKGMLVNYIVNNRAGGNAPLIAQEIAVKFLQRIRLEAGHQLTFWNS